MKHNFFYVGMGVALSLSVLAGCEIQSPDQLSYKTWLDEKEQALTGLNESTLLDNPYADKVDKANAKRMVYFELPENRQDKPKPLSQAELSKLSDQNKVVEPPKGKVLPPDTTSFVFVNMDDAIKKTAERQKLQQQQAIMVSNMKINPKDNKEQPKTMNDLVQQLNAKRALNGLPPIQSE